MHILDSPERVQRRGWKMAGLYKLPQQNAHSGFPREGAEEAGKWQGYTSYLNRMHILDSPERVQMRGWKTAGLYNLLQQNAHSVLPIEGAEERLDNCKVIAVTSTECTHCSPQRVQRRGWKMAGLYKLPQQNAHSGFPREGAEERLENGRVIQVTSTECTFWIPQRGCRRGWKMAGLYKLPQQNAHSGFPREGADERLENGRVIQLTSTECTFCTPHRGCRGEAGQLQGYSSYLNRVHTLFSPEGAEERLENGRVIQVTSTECTFWIPQRGCRGEAGKWQGYTSYLNRMHILDSPERVQKRLENGRVIQVTSTECTFWIPQRGCR
jgi:hypothetical protein